MTSELSLPVESDGFLRKRDSAVDGGFRCGIHAGLTSDQWLPVALLETDHERGRCAVNVPSLGPSSHDLPDPGREPAVVGLEKSFVAVLGRERSRRIDMMEAEAEERGGDKMAAAARTHSFIRVTESRRQLGYMSSTDFVFASYNDCSQATVEAIVFYGVPPIARAQRDFRVWLYHKHNETKWPDDPRWDSEYRVTHTRLANIGYEAHTYLHHMHERYHDLADVTLFLQGDPLVHTPFLTTCDLHRRTRSHPFVAFGTDLDSGRGDDMRTYNCGLAGSLEAMLQSTIWPDFQLGGCFRGTSHGLFSAHASRIRAHPQRFYQNALSMTLSHRANTLQWAMASHVAASEDPESCQPPQDPLKWSAMLYESGWHIIMGEDSCLSKHALAMPFAGKGDEADAQTTFEQVMAGHGPICGNSSYPGAKGWIPRAWDERTGAEEQEASSEEEPAEVEEAKPRQEQDAEPEDAQPRHESRHESTHEGRQHQRMESG